MPGSHLECQNVWTEGFSRMAIQRRVKVGGDGDTPDTYYFVQITPADKILPPPDFLALLTVLSCG